MALFFITRILFRTKVSSVYLQDITLTNICKKHLTLSANELRITCVYASYKYDVLFNLNNIERTAIETVLHMKQNEETLFHEYIFAYSECIRRKFGCTPAMLRRISITATLLSIFKANIQRTSSSTACYAEAMGPLCGLTNHRIHGEITVYSNVHYYIDSVVDTYLASIYNQSITNYPYKSINIILTLPTPQYGLHPTSFKTGTDFSSTPMIQTCSVEPDGLLRFKIFQFDAFMAGLCWFMTMEKSFGFIVGSFLLIVDRSSVGGNAAAIHNVWP